MEYRSKLPENQTALQRFGRWLRLKQYQIEVTFGVYMFTPTEKSIFWSVVFLLSALILIASILYLPQHLVFIISRAWFYVNGGECSNAAADAVAAKSDLLSSSLTSTVTTTITAADTATKIIVETAIPEL